MNITLYEKKDQIILCTITKIHGRILLVSSSKTPEISSNTSQFVWNKLESERFAILVLN